MGPLTLGLRIQGLVALGIVALLTASRALAGVLWPADVVELFRPYVAIAAILLWPYWVRDASVRARLPPVWS